MSEVVTGGIGWSPDFGELKPLLVPEAIKRMIAHTLWVPVSERLPEEPWDGIRHIEDLPKYLVTIEGTSVVTVMTYTKNGYWWRDGRYYKVVAWMPLPDAYREVE